MAYTPRSILAASDLSSASDAVVRSAAILAHRAGAELHLLHSLDLRSVPSDEAMGGGGFLDRLEEARQKLRAQIDRAAPPGVAVASAEIIIYVAHKAILDRAQTVSADLIVVGVGSHGQAAAHFLGTTADRVIRAADVPCLVARSALPGSIRTIGVPIDCSDPARGALEIALAWSAFLGGSMGSEGAPAPQIRLMHVAWPADLADDPDMEERTILPALRAELERAVSRVPGAEALDVEIEVRKANDPADATVRWSESGVDLVIIATHGRRGIERALLGSVASTVARRCSRPVLLVPPVWWTGAPPVDR